MSDTPFIPEIRTITAANATVIEVDERTGWYRPVDDGRDVPGWEYESFQLAGGPVIRVPLRQISREHHEDPPALPGRGE